MMKRAQAKTASTGVGARAGGNGEKNAIPLTRTNNRKSPPMARLTLVSVRNDGHVTGLEPCWTTLGEAANAVLRRLTAGGPA